MKNIYVQPRKITDINDCAFYHEMEIPGHGIIEGKWDIRDNVDAYLGEVDFNGKRVLELGPASGFLSFVIEKRGAEVISYDIGDDTEWDVVPFAQYNYQNKINEFKKYTTKMKNAWWYAHDAYNSKAKAVYGSVYKVPREIGVVDIGTFCAILLHLRDPFLALQSATRLVKETVIVTELDQSKKLVFSHSSRVKECISLVRNFMSRNYKNTNNYKVPYMSLLPNFRTLEHKDVWWALSPEIIVSFLGILGFEKTKVTFHKQKLYGKERSLFTVVGKRTIPIINENDV